MNARARMRHELEAAVLARMELTRTQLLAANVSLRMGAQPARTHDRALSFSNVTQALKSAPNVTLLGSILLGSMLVGPKRIVPLVVRTGLTTWVARSVKGFVGR